MLSRFYSWAKESCRQESMQGLLILLETPGVSNRTKSNKNPIELNRTIGVRLGSAIEQNQTSILL